MLNPQSPFPNPHFPIVALVLAAGESQRMGQAKLLLPWGERTILGETLTQVQASAVAEVLLISGGYREEVEAVAQKYGVAVVHNPAFATGEMLSSLQTGLRHLRGRAGEPPAAVLVMLGDLPFIPTALINQLLAGFAGGLGQIIAPSYEGRRGHPVIIGRELWEDVLALPPTAAPRDLFRQHPPTLLPVTTDLILRDIDTPEEYARWKPTVS
ncbi:MAG: nucleotidyltransferase family protein [Chloroflexi bacterium]|nr:nucleotidyltransferase family protein [Chloroflexota bacterium]